MIKTPLEGLLETELSKIGSSLRPRIYFDDIAKDFSFLAVPIPKDLSPETLSGYYEKICSEFGEAGATDAQLDRITGNVPLFRRRAVAGKFLIDYEIYNPRVTDQSKEISHSLKLYNALIAQRLYDVEMAHLYVIEFPDEFIDNDFSTTGAAYLSGIGISAEGEVNVEALNLDEFGLYAPFLRSIANQFNDTKKPVEIIVSELMRFLGIHK